LLIRRDRGFRMTAPSTGEDRAARAVALFFFLVLVEAFFMLYTDMFRRRMDPWITVVMGTAGVLAFAILIYWLAVPYRADEWFRFSARAKERWKKVPRRRKFVIYANEVASAVAFFAAYVILRNADGTRPLSYDLIVLGYIASEGLLISVLFRGFRDDGAVGSTTKIT